MQADLRRQQACCAKLTDKKRSVKLKQNGQRKIQIYEKGETQMKKTSRSRKLMKSVVLSLALAAVGFAGAFAAPADANAAAVMASQMKNSSITELTNDTRVFKVDKKIQTKMVRFQNRYGIEVAGHLYLPEHFDANKKYSAIVFSGPFGAVKEQSSGLYAQEMAKRGFVTVAFDCSFTGESGGNVHDVASPDIFTEDFHAAVDFVGLLPFVDKERVGAMGICGLGGIAVTAAINDVRIKAVATSALYNMNDSIRNHYKGDYYTPAQRETVKGYLAEMRWKEAELGKTLPGYHEVAIGADGKAVHATGEGVTLLPNKLPEGADPVTTDFFNYYKGRAFHPRAINSNGIWSSTTPYGFFDFDLMAHVEELSPRPLLLITGDKAHSRYHSENVYERAKEPKELIVMPGATHCDLYDIYEKIPFERLDGFFTKHLGK